MASKLARLLAAGDPRPTPPQSTCKVGRILRQLDNGDRRLVSEAFAAVDDNDTFVLSPTALAQILTTAGHPVGDGPVRKHRQKRCTCAR